MISIHAPRAGSDQRLEGHFRPSSISIHAPRAGSDLGVVPCKKGNRDFNPRSPCGERQEFSRFVGMVIQFQSTLPVRGATRTAFMLQTVYAYFNPRSPCGERHTILINGGNIPTFQSTLPVRGATSEPISAAPKAIHFNPRSPCGERQHKCTFFKCVFMKKNLEFVICSSLYVISCRRQQRLSTSSYKYPCEPIQILMYASASLYRISGSSGRYVCLQPKCSILSS